MINDLDYEGIKFPVSKKIIVKLKRKIIFALIYFAMKMNWLFLFMYEIKDLKCA